MKKITKDKTEKEMKHKKKGRKKHFFLSIPDYGETHLSNIPVWHTGRS